MPSLYFEKCMKIVLDEECGSKFFGEEDADQQLVIATSTSMARKLSESRVKGRHGWWNDKICTIEELHDMRDKALSENDHVSVLNFTAMIAMRESVLNGSKCQ